VEPLLFYARTQAHTHAHTHTHILIEYLEVNKIMYSQFF